MIVGVICVCGGFFGAAAGSLLLALFLRTGVAPRWPTPMRTKNVVLGASNGTAAVVFAIVAPVHWPSPWRRWASAASSAPGSARIVVRHAPATPLRLLIAIAGLALAVKLGLDTYR